MKIVNQSGEKPTWCSTDGSSTYRIGQLVAISAASKAATAGDVVPLAVPAGAADTTNNQVIYGVILAFNNKLANSFDSTSEYIAGVTTKAAQLARTWAFQEGMYIKGDPQVLVLVERIYPHTILRAPICNASLGTAPTVVKDTAGTDTTGYTSAGTTGACDFAPVANLASIYCRTGANAGMIRKTSDTSTTTAPAVTVGFPNNVALNDSFVRVPVCKGLSYIYITSGLFLDCSQTPATNYYEAIVTDLDLRDAGKEAVEFSFSPVHFSGAAARS